MHGQILLNENDIYDLYKASPLKGFYATLLGSLEAKEVVSNSSRLEDGKKIVLGDNGIKLKDRELKLSFVVEGLSNRTALLNAITQDEIALRVPKLGEVYHLRFLSLTNDTYYRSTDTHVLEINFHEPDPTNRTA